MHVFKTKSFKLVLVSVALVFVVAILSVSDIFQPKDIPGAEAAGIAITASDTDTCGISTSASGNVTRAGAGANCVIKATTGIIGGNLVVSNGAQVTINAGAKLVLDPGKQIIIDKGNGSKIIMATGGDVNNGIVHGTICVRDDDLDGYINSGTGFTVAPSGTCNTLNSGPDKYIAKTAAVSLTEADCYNSDPAKYSCCTSGYRDYDKDGYGKNNDVSSCYAPDASYNVVANNYDCNDSVPGITTNNTDFTSCGSGACTGGGSNVCTNGVTVYNTCVVSAKACCDVAGNPKTNGTVISSCSSCNGSSADPIAYANGTVCAYGSFGAYGNTSGSCNIYSTRPYYTCSAGACSGSIAGYDYQYQYPPTIGNIWNGSAWAASTCALNTGYGAGYSCSGSAYGSTSQRYSFGCTTGGVSDVSTPTATCNPSSCTNRNENGVSCTGGVCAGASNCADGIDNDSDGLKDSLDPQCNPVACGQCTPGACCDSNGCFTSGNLCGYGGYGAWANSAGSCYSYQGRTIYNCNGAGSCSTAAGTDYAYNYGSNGQVWNGSAWAAASSANKCGTGSYSCSGNASIQLGYYGCNGGNSCSTYMGTYQTTACSGQENSMCVSGNSSCQNMCSSGGPDNNGNGYVDNQDPYCPYSGCGQCTSGTCCNTGTGCYYGTGTLCSSGGFNNPGANSCQRTATDTYCPGNGTSCNGGVGYRYENAPAAGNIWNGSSWQAANCSYNITNIPTVCSGNNTAYNYSGCNTSGGLDATVRGTCTMQSCSGGTPYCNVANYGGGVTAACVACTSAGQCGTNNYWCSGGAAYYRTYSCNSYTCGYGDASQTYCDGVSKICSSGSCVDQPSCPAQTVSGYSVPKLVYGAGTGVNKPACYRASGGYYSATAVCNSGTINIQSETGPTCYSGYRYTYGSWYQSTYGCYDVCVLNCSAASGYGGYSWPNLNSSDSWAVSHLIGNGSVSALINCFDGATNVTNELYTCYGGYYLSGTSCLACSAGYYCPGGQSGQISCPSGTTSGSAASVCYCPAGSAQGYSYPQTNYGSSNSVSKTSPGSNYCTANFKCDPADPWGAIYNDGCTCGYGYGVVSNKVAPATINCSQCNAGQYSTGTSHQAIGGCNECAAGTYSGDGASGCTTCPAGTYNMATNQTGCSQCPSTYYCTGGSSLVSCPSNYTSPAGSTSSGACTYVSVTCGPGQYGSSGSCYSCSPGSYKAGTNTATSCTSCSAGTYNTTSGNSGCSSCPSGSYCTGGSSVSSCSSGTYSTGGASGCSTCSAGTYNTGTGNTGCSTCSAGYYCTGGSNNTYCGAGYTSPSGSSSSGACTLIPITCGPGQYVSGGSCSSCSTGSYKAGTNSATSCTPCSAGSYAIGGGNSSCTSCPAGSYCTGGSSLAACNAGTYSTGSASSCSTCSAGTYNSSSGATSCSTCTANYYCTGGSNYTYCGAGYTSPSGSTSSGACVAPLTCGGGQYVNGGSCSYCSSGTYKSGTNTATSCSSCGGGTYMPTSGASSCWTCPTSNYCPSGSTVPTFCGSGYSSPSGSSYSGQCYWVGT